MLSYDKLKNKPREFLAVTGLTLAEFECLLPAFQTAYERKYPPDLTYEGKARQRGAGGGAKGALPRLTLQEHLADNVTCAIVRRLTLEGHKEFATSIKSGQEPKRDNVRKPLDLSRPSLHWSLL